MTRRRAACRGEDSEGRAMADDEKESEIFAGAREPPPRALTRVSPRVRRLVAPNASPFTFNGTCTYIVGKGEVAIVDPGPGDDSHLAALLAAVDSERVEAILVTHTHRDHSAGVDRLRAATGARVIGAAPFTPHGDGPPGLDSAHDRDYAPDAILTDGERWRGPGYTIEAIATPGHCANHLCFALVEEGALFSGDHVMAWSTSVVAPPDGSMRAYMDSLDKLLGRGDAVYWPTHGPAITDPARHVRAFIAHRREREAGIIECLKSGLETPDAIVERLYVGLNPALRRAAARSVLAHLLDLIGRDIVAADGPATVAAHYRLRHIAPKR